MFTIYVKILAIMTADPTHVDCILFFLQPSPGTVLEFGIIFSWLYRFYFRIIYQFSLHSTDIAGLCRCAFTHWPKTTAVLNCRTFATSQECRFHSFAQQPQLPILYCLFCRWAAAIIDELIVSSCAVPKKIALATNTMIVFSPSITVALRQQIRINELLEQSWSTFLNATED